MIPTSKKAKNTCLAACAFLRFSTVLQHPVFGSSYPNTKTITHSLNAIFVGGNEEFEIFGLHVF